MASARKGLSAFEERQRRIPETEPPEPPSDHKANPPEKPLERLLRYAQRMESIGALARDIAHDFNNTIGAIRANTELLLEDAPPTDHNLQGKLQNILTGCNNASALIRHMQAIGRQTQEGKEPTHVLPLLRGLCDEEERLCEGKPVLFDCQLEAEADLVLAEPTQIQFLFLHLLRKAIHAFDPHGGSIHIRCSICHLDEPAASIYPNLEPGDYFSLEFRIEANEKSRDPLFRQFMAYLTGRQHGEATGLGLAIIDHCQDQDQIPGAGEALQALQDLALVHGIAKGHHGNLRVQGSVEKGIRLGILLPLLRQETPEQAPCATSRIAPPAPDRQAQNIRILFVDDEEILGALVSEMLQNLGHEVAYCDNAEDAVQRFESQPDAWDLIITDQSMAGMSGSELARFVSNMQEPIPVILCSGYEDLMTPDEARAIGIYGLVRKPINIHQLESAIHAALRAHEHPGKKT